MNSEYDAIADQYAKYRTAGVGEEATLRWLKELTPEGRLLDLGCGSGIPLTQLLEESQFQVTGVDASPRLIEISRTNLDSTELICTSVQDYVFPEASFDGVLCWGLMFLLSEADQIALIQNVAKTLKTQGGFLFTSPPIPCTWDDLLTQQESIALGREVYIEQMKAVGLELRWEWEEPKYQNYYYSAIKTD